MSLSRNGRGVVYVLQAWDYGTRRYVEQNRWANRERASITFHKPYWRGIARRLLRIETTLDLQAQAPRRKGKYAKR